jgi:hypothetical protein
MDVFAYGIKDHLCFIVKNIARDRKTIVIFNYPILWGESRDLLMIPGVSEESIRVSLLKGTLRNKILAKEITITCSDIDLIQFNEDQRKFLEDAGVTIGTHVNSDGYSGGNSTYYVRESIKLIGSKNGSNRIFFTPEKFIHGVWEGNIFNIQIFHNGVQKYHDLDFSVSESAGVNSGYDQITFTSFAPVFKSNLYANYAIKSS